MRDVKRIKPLLDKLEKAWLIVPDWRLGQLVSNLKGTGVQDVFFPSDEDWDEMIDDFIENHDKYLNP